EDHLRTLRMRLPAADSAAAGGTDGDGREEFPGRAIAQPRELAHDLVECGIDVIGELDLRHRLQSVHPQADSGCDDAALRNGSVEHAMLAVFSLQPLGAAEHAAEVADVLTEDHDARIALEHNVHGGVDRLDHVPVGHGQPSFATDCSPSGAFFGADPSCARNSARNWSRWRARCAGSCLNTSSNMLAGSS